MSNLRWGDDNWTGILGADAKGYYAWLPAVFIYEDLNLGFFDFIEKEKYYNPNGYYDYRANSGHGQIIDKYYAGVALAEMPFFLGAHAYTKLSGGDADGYSENYLVAVSIAALFYLFCGLWFLRKTLQEYSIPEKTISITLLAAVFGTNLFCYTVVEPGMSHVFSFCFVSAFVYFSKKYFSTFNPRYLLFIGLCFGMIILIRPINLLIVFSWPFLAGGFRQLGKGVRRAFQNPKYFLGALLPALALPFLQLLLYKLATGHFIIYSYQDEGFNFLDPHFLDILFSYRKGLFLYTPLYLLSLFGLFKFWKENRIATLAWLGFFLLITYVFSSWWMWYYGGSFSGRVFVEYIPLFMIPLAVLIASAKRRFTRIAIPTLVFALIVVCQIQTYQYRYYEIHWDQMNKEKYWDVFLMRNWI